MVEPSIQVDHLTTDDRGDWDLCRQIETKDAQIKLVWTMDFRSQHD